MQFRLREVAESVLYGIMVLSISIMISWPWSHFLSNNLVISESHVFLAFVAFIFAGIINLVITMFVLRENAKIRNRFNLLVGAICLVLFVLSLFVSI